MRSRLFTQKLTRRSILSGIAAAPLAAMAAPAPDWTNLFDGHSLNGWRPSENKGSWKVVDGMLAANGPRSHLFYNGPVHGADFKNFELEVELITQPRCNSGIYFHTAYQESGFPEKGFEVQINNTALGDGGYMERKKTGSLYGLRNMYKQLVPDQKPFRVNVAVRGKDVQIRLNGELLVDYVEPTPPVIPAGGEKQRYLDHGTFALQCHNDGSHASYRSVRVRPLPDNLPAYIGPVPVVDEVYREIIDVGRHNVPMVDYHVLLHQDLSLETALRKSRKDGIQYGVIAAGSALRSDAEAAKWLHPMQGKPVFFGLSADSGEWTRHLSQSTAKQFDYVIADGKQDLAHAQGIDQLIETRRKRLDEEPLDIYSGVTSLPASMKSKTGELWTTSRQAKLIEALARNKVAIELSTLDQLPGESFIRQAKDAGCKFGFGTANSSGADLKRCEYGLRMVEACKLDWNNFYTPGSWWPKAVERRWHWAS